MNITDEKSGREMVEKYIETLDIISANGVDLLPEVSKEDLLNKLINTSELLKVFYDLYKNEYELVEKLQRELAVKSVNNEVS